MSMRAEGQKRLCGPRARRLCGPRAKRAEGQTTMRAEGQKTCGPRARRLGDPEMICMATAQMEHAQIENVKLDIAGSEPRPCLRGRGARRI